MRVSPLPFALFPRRSASLTSLAMAAVLLSAPALLAQDAAAPQSQTTNPPSAAEAQSSSSATHTPQVSDVQADTMPAPKPKRKWIQKDDSRSQPRDQKKSATDVKQADAAAAGTPKPEKVAKEDRVVPTKDTKAELRREQKYNPLAGKDATLPDKELYDKALVEDHKGHFDVARLDLQTLLNTYPESQYLMRAKLAVANSWFEEGGSAAMAQAEQEFGDFITFFPNAPEAAEAQMRMGDIYMRQMDVPDRDYANALKAEEQYRVMLKTYPDAPPVIKKQAEQDLRDVQEVLAQREFELGQFYAGRQNLPAAIARYQTVADTYPLFSHMDDVLIGLGDAYEADANAVRNQVTCETPHQYACIQEAAKARLLEQFESKAAAYYRDVVLNHAASAHVEDAKERLQTMNLPLPTPTAQQVAASEALEGSRATYTMQKRLELLLVRKPDTVIAARAGAPPLDDASPTVAPTVRQAILDDFRIAQDPAAAKEIATRAPAPTLTNPDGSASPVQPVGTPGKATLSLSEPATASAAAAADSGTVTEVETVPDNAATGGGSSVGNRGASLGAEVLPPGATTTEPAGVNGTGNVAPGTMTGAPVSGLASSAPAATGQPDPNYGIPAVRPTVAAVPPPVEAPAQAPDAVNEAAGLKQAPTPAVDPNAKKKPKPEYDKNDESSSKHHKKKGIDKLNPF